MHQISVAHAPTETISFVDQYCALYQELFPDVRSFEHFELLDLGFVAELPRKSLSAIAKAVGLQDGLSQHQANWYFRDEISESCPKFHP